MLDLAEILVVFAALFLPGTSAGQTGSAIVLILSVAVAQTLLLLTLMAQRGPGALARAGVRAFATADLLAAAAAAVVLLAFSSGLGWLLSRLGEAMRPRPTPLAALSPAALALLALATGYREELFYRCYLITRLAGLGLPGPAALAVAAAVFALGHLYQGPAAVLLALVQGLAFGVLLRRGFSLHTLALSHAAYNFVVLLGRSGPH